MYEGMDVDILHEFEEAARYADRGAEFLRAGMCVHDPAKQAEQSKAWKAAHPARVRAAALRARPLKGTRPGPVGRTFTDQHGARYASLSDAARRCGMNRTCVHAVLVGRRASAKGYVFEYEEGTS